MAFPLIPLLLVAAAGGAVYVAVTKSNAPSNQPVVKHGVEYGPQCSSVKVVDMQVFNQHLMSKKVQIDALGNTLTPATKARDALAAVMQLMLPGPGCSWADPSFDTAIVDPTGGDVVRWQQLIGAFGDQTFADALENGAFDIAGGLQLSVEPTIVGIVYSSLLYRLA